MARTKRGLPLCFFVLLSLLLPPRVRVSAQRQQPQQQSRGGFRRLYVLQPGPGPGPGRPGSAAAADGALRVSSISTRHGAAGQPHTYNVELSANFGGQVRTRRMGSGAAAAPQRPSGVNVCGGQCCHGWSQALGSQRCTKPNCVPQCQNGGMCLRPQLCVCKPGSKGQACEQKAAPGASNGHANGPNAVPQRPIPQQAPPSGHAPAPPPAANMAQKLTVKPRPQVVRPYYIQQQVRPLHPAQSQQYVLKPKYYHTHTETHIQSHPERPIPLAVGHHPVHAVGNHTGRIKVVFTPTICKLTCVGGRCHNNCELGNTTTIISENGRATDTLTAPNFRVVVCHLPCINGGKCSARDKCQCPPNFTGKFCQMPVQGRHQQAAGGYSQTQVHSTHTLPLTYGNGQSTVFSPSIVNIHIKHPPEASVQVHQVSQLDNYHNNGHQLKTSQSGSSSSSTSYTYHHTENSQKVQHHIVYPGQHDYQAPPYPPVSSKNALGRCFQETAGNQCGKALPGLSQQEQCCATIGTSWGFHKCLKCPKTPSIPLIDCPRGYRRTNTSSCQDLDECQLHGACPNGNCVNTVGSYRCMCKPGYIPDPTLTTCISNTPATQEEKGSCFRVVSSGRQCLHPVSAQLSKQLCCCSVGKAWGPRCDKCPLPGTATFKETCPGGMGYTVLPNPPVHKPVTYQEPTDLLTPQPLPTPERPVEAFWKPEELLPATSAPDQELVVPVVSERPLGEPVLSQLSPGVSTVKMEAAYPEVVERSSPPAPVEVFPSNAGQDIAPTQSTEVDECQINPGVCGQGVCYNAAEAYTCHCYEGYGLDDAQSTCVDVDECVEDSSLCFGGRCRNTEGSFLCSCPRGFLLDDLATSCVDVDECENGSLCPSGICINVPGSFTCETCPHGFSAQGGQCVDIDECQDQWVCTRGHCLNSEGSFSCVCGAGFRRSADGDQCDDVDECVENERPCAAVGACVNSVGSYTCTCPQGFRQVNGTSCRDVDECTDESDLCSPHGECLNTDGSYVCVCGSGFSANLDTPSCDDIDECGVNATLCGPHGFCENRMGSFQCLCDQGYQVTPDGQACVDVNECKLLSSMCGEAECVNVDGSFLCVCPSGQDYNVVIAKCEPVPTVAAVPPVERKECYYHLNDKNLCESVLTSHVTLQECCCTLGAGWGDNCEVHPCPVNGTDHFNQMCPSGRGSIPGEEVLFGAATADSYRDADECALFGKEVCKGGFCLDTVGSFECYCKSGHDYDPATLECRDIDECLDEAVCAGAQCLNTDGAYMCFCTHPMVLDPSSNRCVVSPEADEHHEAEEMAYQGICWQVVTESMTCTQPLGLNRKTTYTECCCLYGQAWGMDCALCPPTNSADFASMCNLPLEGGRRPYGQDALHAGPIQAYELRPGYPPSSEHQAALPPYENEEYPYKAFEGLRAEECGILNGCENGRCVRVQEGYTCDCFDGYTLDLSRMSCVDVNECSELNKRMSLCRNAKCINTLGSYRCECLPGFTASDRANYCVEAQ